MDNNTYFIGMGDYCMPLNTEILTKNGWKTHDQLSVGDIVCAYNKDTDKLNWTPLRGLYYSPSQKTYRMKSKSFDFICTNNHGWFISDQYNTTIRKMPLSELKTSHRIRTVALMDDSVTFPYLNVTPEDCYLLGWIVTDGHTRQKGNGINVSITQSAKKYLHILKNKLKGKYTASYSNNKNDCETINIKTSIIRELFEKFGYTGKESLPEIVTHLNLECRRAMLSAFHEAEGWIERNNWCFAQHEGGVLESYRILCTLNGVRIGVSHKAPNGVVTHKESNRINTTVNDLKITEIKELTVWCPMIDFSSIVARQGNTITITGNSDFASTREKKYLSSELHESTTNLLDEVAEKHNRELAGELSFMKGHVLGLIEGNHSWRFEDGKTSTEDLAQRLGTKDMGWLCHYTLTVKAKNHGSCIAVHMILCHGKAGGKTLGITVNQVGDLKNIWPVADLYVMGHDHQRVAHPCSVLVPQSGKYGWKVKQKRQLLCRSGTFMKAYQDNSNSYEIFRLYRPSDMGALKVNLMVERNRTNDEDILSAALTAEI